MSNAKREIYARQRDNCRNGFNEYIGFVICLCISRQRLMRGRIAEIDTLTNIDHSLELSIFEFHFYKD